MDNLQLVLNTEAPMQFYIVNMTLLGNLFRLQQIKKYYKNATCFATVVFKFTSEKIQLGLGKQQTEDNWVIFPHIHPCTVSIIHKYVSIVIILTLGRVEHQWVWYSLLLLLCKVENIGGGGGVGYIPLSPTPLVPTLLSMSMACAKILGAIACNCSYILYCLKQSQVSNKCQSFCVCK